MAKLMQELQRHSDFPFELEFLVMDPGCNEINRQKIESNARLLHIPITIFETNVFEVANGSEKEPLLSVRPDAARPFVQQGKGPGLQQNRAGAPLQRRDRNHGDEHVLRQPASRPCRQSCTAPTLRAWN